MNSFHYGLALLAILIIMRWYITSDETGRDDGSAGLLAMKSDKPKPVAPPSPPSSKRSFRRKA